MSRARNVVERLGNKLGGWDPSLIINPVSPCGPRGAFQSLMQRAGHRYSLGANLRAVGTSVQGPDAAEAFTA